VHEFGGAWALAGALLDEPRTVEELEEYFRIMERRFGMFFPGHQLLIGGREGADEMRSGGREGTKDEPLSQLVRRGIDEVLERGWAYEHEGRYHLTDAGRKEARRMLKELERSGVILKKATDPQTVSTVTMIVHFLLAAVKLPAALLSGSVGLLNDSLDTLMDGVASLFVFFGVRSGKERLVSYLLLVFMTLTGLYSLYEAISSVIRSAPLTPEPLSAAAVGISAVFCGLLWLYQKYAGLKHSCVPLIAQSIDSRNHVLVAGGVAAGLIAAYFEVYVIDQVVGLAVAVLILKGAVELLIDLVRSEGEEELDLSRYGFTRLQAHRKRQMVYWLLYGIREGRIRTRRQMAEEMRAATDFSRVASLRAIGLDESPGREEALREAVEEVFSRQLAAEISTEEESSKAAGEPQVELTEKGEEELHKALTGGVRMWSSAGGGVRNKAVRGAAFIIRFLWSGVLFTGIFLAARWLIGFLPSLELWAFAEGGEGLLPMLVIEAGSFVPFAPPFSMTAVQLGLWAGGLLFFYHGRMLVHRGHHALHHVRDRHSHGRAAERPRFLVTKGVFAARRHPMYTGFILLHAGIGVSLHSVYGVGWAVLMTLLWFFNGLRDERQLAAWFRREYRDYAQQVPVRLLSWRGWTALGLFYCAAAAGLFVP
jgi:protein-S-isoprenylcysteine O-methyltransferase Ste14/Co/Zn/Cd efflux system component